MDDCLEAFSTLFLSRKRIEFYEIFFHQVVGPLKPALVDDIFDKRLDDFFIRRGHGRSPL